MLAVCAALRGCCAAYVTLLRYQMAVNQLRMLAYNDVDVVPLQRQGEGQQISSYIRGARTISKLLQLCKELGSSRPIDSGVGLPSAAVLKASGIASGQECMLAAWLEIV